MIELRPDDKGATVNGLTKLDEVVCDDVRFLHAEMLGDDHLWIGINRHDGSRTSLNIRVDGQRGKRSLHLRGEQDEGPARSDVILPEPPPVRSPGSVDVWPLVWDDIRVLNRRSISEARDKLFDDMHARSAQGFAKYGTTLHTKNGRNHIVDAYQETLDQIVYLRAAIEDATLDELTRLPLVMAYHQAIDTATLLCGCVNGIVTTIWTLTSKSPLSRYLRVITPTEGQYCKRLWRRADDTLMGAFICVSLDKKSISDDEKIIEVNPSWVTLKGSVPPAVSDEFDRLMEGAR